jgi:hypothetical protein
MPRSAVTRDWIPESGTGTDTRSQAFPATSSDGISLDLDA